jgi:hypothetical protein
MAGPMTARFLFAARMNGAQEVPATSSSGVGVATFHYNNTGDTLCVTMTVNGLSGPITGAHIHEGPVGVSGPISVDLVPFLSGNSLQATLTGATLASLDKEDLFGGQYYINVHTAANPGGEIRGQILLEEDRGMMVNLIGANENPPVTTNGRGLAFFKLSSHNQKLNIYVVLDSLNGVISGAHLHSGKAGINGPVIENLMPFLNGNVINATVDPTLYLNAIWADSVYINVHTAINPGGSIRGQLHFEPYLHFDARMNGIQEVPPTATSAQGLSVLRVNYTLDSIWFDVLTHGLTGPINAGHLHHGAFGVSGAVRIPFPAATIVGSHISGKALLLDSLREFLLKGELYSNVHTTIYPGGEMRGQAYRTLREGYTFAMAGDQENPPTSTFGYGSGMVSIDRNDSDAHFMIVGTQITPTLAHFHKAMAGTNGGVIFNLVPFLANNGMFGYWRENDATTPFTSTISQQFQADSIYANMHTAANPGGDIRGQVLRQLCTGVPKATATGVNTAQFNQVQLDIVPNPVSGNAALRLQLPKSMQAEIQLTDLSGKVIWNQSYKLESGNRTLKIPAENLPAGMYFLRLVGADGQQSRKLIKI